MEKYWDRMTKAELEVELERINDEIASALLAEEFENWDDLMWSRGELEMRLRGGNYAEP
jgi:hypothetical protein